VSMCQLDSCTRPANDGTICWHHTWQLERDLRGIPDLLIELDLALARQTKNGPTTDKVQGKGETSVYFNPRAGEAFTGLRDAVVGWAREYGMPWAEFATTSSAHLLRVLPTSRARGDLPQMCDEITDACRRARAATDSPAHRTVIPVGPCPENNTEGDSCTGKVFAFIPADDRPGRMTCDANPTEHTWGSVQWHRTGRRILDKMARQKRNAG